MQLALLQPIGIVIKLSYGENSHRTFYEGCCYGIHAEMASLRHLSRSKRTRNKYWDHKRLTVNLCVIRVNSIGNYCMSKPCAKCVKILTTFTWIKIKNLSYSTANGTICTIKFNKFLETFS